MTMGTGRRPARRMAVAGVLALVTTLVAQTGPAYAAPTVRGHQWHLDTLRIDEVHRVTTGEGVVVAVVDSGVDATHPDLAGQVLEGSRMTGDQDKGLVDNRNHGTGVAGLIAGNGRGPDSVLGIAPGAKILPVKVFSGGLGGTDVPQGIRYAVDQGADVINVSMSVGQTDRLLEALHYAQSHDVVVVASAGNKVDAEDPEADPDRGVEVTGPDSGGAGGVGGRRQGALLGRWSARPGDRPLRARRRAGRPHRGRHGASRCRPLRPGYDLMMGGTSAASPIVAGAAALLRAQFPELSAANVVNRLIATADDLGAPGRDEEFGFGQVNILRALTEEVPEVSEHPLGKVPSPDLGPRTELWTPDLTLILVVGLAFGVVVMLAGGGPDRLPGASQPPSRALTPLGRTGFRPMRPRGASLRP